MLDDGPILLPGWAKVFTFMEKKVQGFSMHTTGYIFGGELGLVGWAERKTGGGTL
jgi:peptide/nickel transport system substrate-binding protein